jgi:hypothetical protein
MGLFTRKLRPGADLRQLSNERLIQEFAKVADIEGRLNAMDAADEFGTKDNPVMISADAFVGAVNDARLFQEISTELRRRGLNPQVT